MVLPCSQSHSPLRLLSPPPSHFYQEECEALVNKQINMELYAGYVYIAMASYFDRVDQALPGFACFFKKSPNAVRNHGGTLMEYQAKRGGKVVLQDITKPTRMEWGTPLEAMTAVLELEKTVTPTLQDLQTVATEKKDFHLTDFIQREFVGKKVNIIKEIGDCLTKIKRAGDGPGLYIVDRDLEKMMTTADSHLVTVIQRELLGKQVANIKEITDCLATVKMV